MRYARIASQDAIAASLHLRAAFRHANPETPRHWDQGTVHLIKCHPRAGPPPYSVQPTRMQHPKRCVIQPVSSREAGPACEAHRAKMDCAQTEPTRPCRPKPPSASGIAPSQPPDRAETESDRSPPSCARDSLLEVGQERQRLRFPID